MGIGIDFGKVIMGAIKDGKADTTFLGTSLETAMTTPPEAGVFESVRELVEMFEGRVFIVSKCGASVERKTRAWLEHWRFFEMTGLAPGNLYFCRERHEKAPICQSLDIEHFIDDRADVLEHMRGQVKHLYLFGEQDEAAPSWVMPVANWKETMTHFGPIGKNA